MSRSGGGRVSTDTPLTLSALLRNLEGELSQLGARCRALQDVTGTAVQARQGAAGTSLAVLVALQDLDAITQTLEDLACLAGDAANSGFARVRVDADAIRSVLRLESLARRLLGTVHAEGSEADAFLL